MDQRRSPPMSRWAPERSQIVTAAIEVLPVRQGRVPQKVVSISCRKSRDRFDRAWKFLARMVGTARALEPGTRRISLRSVITHDEKGYSPRGRCRHASFSDHQDRLQTTPPGL